MNTTERSFVRKSPRQKTKTPGGEVGRDHSGLQEEGHGEKGRGGGKNRDGNEKSSGRKDARSLIDYVYLRCKKVGIFKVRSSTEERISAGFWIPGIVFGVAVAAAVWAAGAGFRFSAFKELGVIWEAACL